MRLIFKIFYNFLDNYFHKPRIEKFLKKMNLKCSTIIDVGSHTGESIDFFNTIYPNSNIYAFEPQKDCFDPLKKKYLSNSKITVLNFALGEKKEIKKLNKNFLSSTSTFSKLNHNSKHFKIKSFILGSNAGFYKEEIVNVETLTFFFEKYNFEKIDILKIDTEGYEMEALNGLKRISSKIKVIIIEHNYTDYYMNYSLSNTKNYLSELSFKNLKNFKFPLMKYTDSIYINTKF